MATNFTSWDAGLHSNDPNSFQHYGVIGMKWGQRRYQKSDGSLTAAGKRHYEQTGEYGYHYKSHSTKKYQRKSAKAREKLSQQVKKDITTSTKDGVTTHTVKVSNKAEKLSKKVAKYEGRAKRSAELDSREQEYAQRVRTGGNIVARVLTSGLIGGKAYQQHLAMNGNTTNRGSKVTSAILANIGGHAFSSIRKASYLRQDEKAEKRAIKGKSADRGAEFRKKTAAAKAAFENLVDQAADSARNAYNNERKKRRQG